MNHRCPDDETLAAYFDGLLPPGDEAALHEEMLTCSECVGLAAAIGLVVRDEPNDAFERAPVIDGAITEHAISLWPEAPLPDFGDMLRVAIRWVDDLIVPLTDALTPLGLSNAAVRGGPEVRAADPSGADELRYRVTLGELSFEIDLEVDGPRQIALHIRPLTPPPSGLLVRLTAQGETRAMNSIGQRGTTLPALRATNYRLVIEHGDRALGHLDLALGSTR